MFFVQPVNDSWHLSRIADGPPASLSALIDESFYGPGAPRRTLKGGCIRFEMGTFAYQGVHYVVTPLQKHLLVGVL
jgi:hypothetical protein